MMFTRMLTIALLATSVAWGQAIPEDHAAHHPAEPPAAAAAAKPAPAAQSSDFGKRVAMMQDLIDRAGKTHDPIQRKRLLQQHSDAMRAQLADLGKMDCRIMMNMEAKGDMTGKGESSNVAAKSGMMGQVDMMQCHDMMKSRMDMLVQLMDQIIQRQDAAVLAK